MKITRTILFALFGVTSLSSALRAQSVTSDHGFIVTEGQTTISQDLSIHLPAGGIDSYAGYLISSDANVSGGVLAGTDITVSSDSSSKYLFGIELEDGATLGKVSGNITVSSKYDDQNDLTAGIYMGENTTIGDIDGTISVSSGASPKVYAIYFENAANSSMGVFSGTIKVNSEVPRETTTSVNMEDNAISGYDSSSNADTLNNGMSNAYIYNASTGSSAGVLVDWSTASFDIRSANTFAMGAIIGAGSTSISTVGGTYSVHSGLGSIGFMLSGTGTEFSDADFTGYINSATTGEGSSIGFRLTFENGTGSEFGNFTQESTITATALGTGSARGINFDYGSKIGALAGAIYTSSQDGLSIGLDSASSMSGGNMGIYGDISGTIQAYSCLGDSYGMRLGSSYFTGTISGDILAHSLEGDSYGISYTRSTWITLASTGVITAIEGDKGKESHGIALQNTSSGIFLRTDGTSTATDRAQINGNLDAGEKKLTFAGGYFEIDARNMTSSIISLGSGTSMVDVAVVNSSLYQTNNDLVELTSTSMDIYLNSNEDFSFLLVDDSLTLDMSSISDIDIYLNEGFFPEDESIFIQLIDANLIYLTEELGLSVTIHNNLDGRLEYEINETGLYLFETNGDITIPEPSTATLSLLALTALLLRRRRQSL